MIGFYIRVVAVLIIAIALYTSVLPVLVSGRDNILVLVGIAGALIFPVLAGKYLITRFRKIK